MLRWKKEQMPLMKRPKGSCGVMHKRGWVRDNTGPECCKLARNTAGELGQCKESYQIRKTCF